MLWISVLFFLFTDKVLLQYIINVLYTCIGENFETWIKAQVDAHREGQRQDQVVEMDPQIAELFQNSTAISCKCNFLNFMLTLLSCCSGERQRRVTFQASEQETSHQGRDP